MSTQSDSIDISQLKAQVLGLDFTVSEPKRRLRTMPAINRLCNIADAIFLAVSKKPRAIFREKIITSSR